MNVIAVLLLLQQTAPAVDLAQPRSPELDAANDCLVLKTGEWLKEYDWRPTQDERWRWATRIVEQCDTELKASVLPTRDPQSPARKLAKQTPATTLTNGQLRRTEALYYVDGMIRSHFEKAI